ncbi:MAG: acetyl-CoA C-acetyltransferase [Deltaproteobacteria bacterium]|nr:acetyl-CoA C-acetyltransferase [Deltaproteobacteria bacterium]
MTKKVVIVSMARTPIGSFMGSLASFSAPTLGSFAIKAAVERAGISADVVSEVIMGNVLTAGVGQAPARQAAKMAGLPNHVPALTIGKVCGSGLKAVMLASQAIALGDAEVVVAGGMESMSNAPYALPNARKGYRLGNATMIDTMVHDGLWDAYNNYHMGNAAELCAKECGISRENQDAFTIESYTRAIKAQKAGKFTTEIVPVEIKDRKGNLTVVTEDEEPQTVNYEKIPTLRPVFDKDGTITAANASTINDGAAALVLMSEEKAKDLGCSVIAEITGYTQAAREPEWFTIAPADAIAKLGEKLGWDLRNDVDLYEINEAFSVVSLAVNDKLHIDASKVNIYGGAVSLGHPIGASGARILITLLSALQQENKQKGIASLCIGGGEAVALGVQR